MSACVHRRFRVVRFRSRDSVGAVAAICLRCGGHSTAGPDGWISRGTLAANLVPGVAGSWPEDARLELLTDTLHGATGWTAAMPLIARGRKDEGERRARRSRPAESACAVPRAVAVAAISTGVLDQILAIQFTVAWAGEALSMPPRLGWWRTDVCDEAGGGDLLDRLLPRTHAWAALQLARHAARLVDDQSRLALPGPDQVRTLFSMGFDLDERLEERILVLKRQRVPPANALPFALDLGATFERTRFETAARGGAAAPSWDVVPGGRQLHGLVPDAPEVVVQNLAAAILPLADRYPMPFYRVHA